MNISVAICTYNGEKFLRQQLDSILLQTVCVNEVIICDDLSTDSTIEILQAYKNKYPGLIKIFINEKTLKTVKNFEKAIALTTGDIIFLADQDDIWCLDKVEIMQRFFYENKNCKLLFSDAKLIDEKGGDLDAMLWDKWGFTEEIQNKWKNNKNAFKDLIANCNKITGATVCFHNSLKSFILPIELPEGYWHDAWLGLHASAQQGLMFTSQSLISYRIHENQQVGISRIINEDSYFKSIKKYIFVIIFFKKLIKIYPNEKGNLPILETKNILIKLLKKLKKKFRSILN